MCECKGRKVRFRVEEFERERDLDLIQPTNDEQTVGLVKLEMEPKAYLPQA